MSRGASIRTRETKSGKRFQVRWREVISGEKRLCSETFDDFVAANKFKNTVSARLSVVSRPLGMMADHLRPAGNIDLCIEEYIADIRLTSKITSAHPKSEKDYLVRCTKKYSWKNTADVHPRNLRDYIQECNDKNVGAFPCIACIKRFIKWGTEKYKVNMECLTVKVRRSVHNERIYWTRDQVMRILSALQNAPPGEFNYHNEKFKSPWAKRLSTLISQRTFKCFILIFRMMIIWALRPGEASRLLVRDWNSDLRKITITSQNAKNQSLRSFPVDKDTADMINTLCDNRKPTDHIFLSQSGIPWKVHNLTKIFSKLLRKIDIPGSLYCARHYAASQLLKKHGINGVRAVMSITGHKTYTEFMKYIHAWDSELQDIADSDYAADLNQQISSAKIGPLTNEMKTSMDSKNDKPPYIIDDESEGANEETA